jgi:hypothetical protein
LKVAVYLVNRAVTAATLAETKALIILGFGPAKFLDEIIRKRSITLKCKK